MKKSEPWYQVNIYPATKRGKMTVVIIENKGYDLRCSKHRGRNAGCCTDWRKPSMLHTAYDTPLPKGTEPADIVLRALGLLAGDRVEWQDWLEAYVVRVPRR